MEYEKYIEQGLNGEAPLKLILCGNVQSTANDKVGVVSVMFATNDKELAEQKIYELTVVNPNNSCIYEAETYGKQREADWRGIYRKRWR